MLILSLFPGLGMLDMAFEAEIPGACIVRGPDAIWGGDIRTFHPPAGRFDGVIGGPPCQTFSALANLVRARGGETTFGNLIPEFERCVAEAAPQWFLMENVPAAPVPAVDGYGVRDFVFCNSWVAGEDGWGQEQMRKRRFSFGVRGESAPDLRRWIKPAALFLPTTSAVLGDARQTPVALGGSGKPKRSRSVVAYDSPSSGSDYRTRQRAVQGGHDETPWHMDRDEPRRRQRAITGANHRPKGGAGERRSLAEMCRLQGMPEDWLEHCPMTMQGKRKAVANGVPMPLGIAIAAAVREAAYSGSE